MGECDAIQPVDNAKASDKMDCYYDLALSYSFSATGSNNNAYKAYQACGRISSMMINGADGEPKVDDGLVDLTRNQCYYDCARLLSELGIAAYTDDSQVTFPLKQFCDSIDPSVSLDPAEGSTSNAMKNLCEKRIQVADNIKRAQDETTFLGMK
ncbi:MAG: hypothetical protein ACP5NX_00925 [Candidatus Bilamarchaeaceae archaeon]